MKIVHIADLHLGKTIHGVNLIEQKDQTYWVEQFVELMKEEKPNVILIAGDVYDRSAPSNEAVKLLDHMLTSLSEVLPETSIMMVAGNHDSGQRLSFGSALLKKQNIHIAGILEKEIYHETLFDEYGPVTFWLLPYLFPSSVNQVLGTEFRDSDRAMRALLAEQNMDTSVRNVLVAHQNVLAFGKEGERGGSETMVGGIGEIDYTAFDEFDYVALGHIHAAQAMGRKEVRYAGSPLCYHFSETKRPKKGPIVVELGEKGTELQLETRIIPALHPMREVKGTLSEIIEKELDSNQRNEYIRVVLQEEKRAIDTDTSLRALFAQKGSQVLEIAVERSAAGKIDTTASEKDIKEKSIVELFADFWYERTEEDLSEQDTELLKYMEEQLMNVERMQKRPTSKQIQAIIDFASKQED